MNDTIKKAIEGGWDCQRLPSFDGVECLNHAEVCLDPQFWQCLGKALGYKEKGEEELIFENCCFGEEFMPWWKYKMHCLIDHLASGKDADSFFTEPLAKKP